MQTQPGSEGRRAAMTAVVVVTVALTATACGGASRPGSQTSTKPAHRAPAVAYYDSSTQTVHRPGERPVKLGVKRDVFNFTELADGRLLVSVARPGAADGSEEPPTTDLLVLDANGATLDRFASWGYGLTAAAGGRSAAWIGDGGTPMVLEAESDEPVELDPLTEIAGSRIEPVEITGDCGSEAGCNVYAVDSTADSTLWEASTSHPPQRYAGDGGVAVSPDGRYFLAKTSASDEELCVGLWDRDQIGGESDPDPLGEECMPGMLGPHYEFSPNGRWIVAQHGEGYGPSKTQILDGRTLKVVATASDADAAATYHHAAWEDNDSVLLVVDHNQRGLEDGIYELQRLHRNGKIEKLGIQADLLASQ